MDKKTDVKSKPKSARRINVIDILFILVLVGILLVALSYFTPFSPFNIKTNGQTVEYTLRFEGVDADMADSVRVGDTAFDPTGKVQMGSVTEVKTEPAVQYLFDRESGEMMSAAVPEGGNGKAPVTLNVTLKVEADYAEGEGLTVNGIRLSVGTPIRVGFSGFYGNGSCTSIYRSAVAD